MKQPPTNICPLRAIAGIGTSSGSAVCLEDRCAWAYDGGCAITTIARCLDDLTCDLTEDLNEDGINPWIEKEDDV